MPNDIIHLNPRALRRTGLDALPTIIATAGESAAKRFLEFFTVTIRNRHTREAYANAVRRFLDWCELRGVTRLEDIEPIMVAAYIEHITPRADREDNPYSLSSVKLHLAGIRMLFDWLVTGQVIATNPASSVRGPKHVVRKGKTPVLDAEQCRKLLDSIDTTTITGLRDRALIAVMTYSFARVSAAVAMNVRDFYWTGTKWELKLRQEKGGKFLKNAAHHNVVEYLSEYVAAAGIRGESKTPLFRTVSKERTLTTTRFTRTAALRMVKRRAKAIGLPPDVCNHTFRATGITNYMKNGGTLDKAAKMAGHSSERTTGLYNRVDDEVSLNEVERISI